MTRPLIGKKPMTAAQRQRRRRAKLRKAERTEHERAGAARARFEGDKRYIPMPPGITLWRKIRVRGETGGFVETWKPDTKPLAACGPDLDDSDVLALLNELHGIAQERGLDPGQIPAYPRHTEPLGPDECVTVSALPRASG